MLSQPSNAFPKPSPQTKTAFETKTSAINVTPSNTARYDIKEIKEDALWLSNEAGIDEVSALRVVVEEFQSRAYAQLLGEFSEEENLSLQDAADTQSSNVLSTGLLLTGTTPDALQKKFDAQESRRIRLLHIYLSERRYLWKCLVFLVQQRSPHDANKGSDDGRAIPWFNTYHVTVVSQWDALEAPADRIVRFIATLTSILEKTFSGSGSGWFKDDGGRVDIEIEWTNSQIMEATYIMEIIFQHLWAVDTITQTAPILEWFRFVSRFDFFDPRDYSLFVSSRNPS